MDFKSERNKVGVDDMVMLDQINETSILENIKKRYKDGIIYTAIGAVLISMNPYKDLGVFSKANINKYSGKQPFELPPHVFSLADETYRSLLSEGEDQCIIISGESGAGKTEASKGIMQFIAAVSGRGQTVDSVKNIILESNPLLESFGNSKTLRNNNSSRFGKYIEIQFNSQGDPEGGKITNYLLEKSRVIYQIVGERNFHIFYQLFSGGSPDEKNLWKLTTPDKYIYLNKGNCYTADGIQDAAEFRTTKRSMEVMGITNDEQSQIFRLIASILHLGNLNFKPDKEGCQVADKSVLSLVASMMMVKPEILERALSFRTINSGSARTSIYSVPQKPDQAAYSRDALAKGIYSRLFDWLVGRINKMMEINQKGKKIGILDIYGFEIFEFNQFEQLCINYVNETLQQIFIDLTLKTEQEEYVREGVKWENISYVNNKPCVDLIEGKPMGILSLLDEECLFPEGTDKSFLDKMHKNFATNKYYQKVSGNTGNDKFSLSHYAGTVTYSVVGFLDKNRDTLFTDLMQLCLDSQIPLLNEIFLAGTPVMEVDYNAPSNNVASNNANKFGKGAKKRPVTAGFQFKNSVAALLKSLYSCQPHYIRCIKPNDDKRSLVVDDKRTAEQIRYLGLLENVRVRRAGYCYRQTFAKWFKRFYMISKQTFPKWLGPEKDAVEILIKELEIPTGEFQLGKTKLFIRSPKTLFDMEERRLNSLNRIATIIQKVYRSWRSRKEYIALKKEYQDIFKGKKERNRQSMMRGTTAFYGDFLGLQENLEIKNLFTSNGDKELIFSDIVNKVNKRFKVQERILLASDKALYNMEKLKKPKKGSLYMFKRRIPFDKIESVSLSTLSDNYFVVHVPSEYDYVYESPKKTIFITLLNNVWRKQRGIQLKLNFLESIEYKVKKGQAKAKIGFGKDETAISPHLKKKGNLLEITVKSGVKE